MRRAFDLKPLAFGDVMGRGFSLYASAFVGFVRWFLIAYTLPMLVLTLGLYFLFDPYGWVGHSARTEQSVLEATSRAAYYWLLKLAAIVLGFSVGAAGIYYQAARVYVGGKPTLGEVVKALGTRSGHMLGSSFLFVILLLVITIACFAIPAGTALDGNVAGGVALAVLFAFGWVPLIGWYTGSCGLCVPVTVLDDCTGGESFTRSLYLTKGYRMRLFGVLISAMLLVGAPGVPGLLTLPAWIGQELLLTKAGSPLAGDLIRVCWDGFLLPLFFAPVVVYYFDMRCRKEGYDLAVMARNFGIEEGEMMRYRMNPHMGYTPPGYKPPKGRRSGRQPVVRPPQPQPFMQPHWQQQPPPPGWMPPPPGWQQVPQMPPPSGWQQGPQMPPPPGWQQGPATPPRRPNLPLPRRRQ